MAIEKGRLGRRRFLGTTGLGLFAPSLITTRALGAAGKKPASERVVAALIGCGGRGAAC